MEVVLVVDLADPVIDLPTPLCATTVKVLELEFSGKYQNIDKINIEILENKLWKSFTIEHGFYDVEILLSYLNSFSNNVQFALVRGSDTVDVFCLEGAELKISQNLQRLFGLNKAHFPNGHHRGKTPLNLSSNEPKFVFCNFVKDRLINGKYKPVLHVISQNKNTVSLQLNGLLHRILTFKVLDSKFNETKFFPNAEMIIRLWFS